MTATDSTEPTIQAHRDADTPLSHVAVVSAIYDAFGRGDVSTILGFLDDDVRWDADWSDNWAQRTPLDHLTPRHGHTGVSQFFQALSAYTVRDFQLLDLLSSERQVVAEVLIELDTPSGGRFRDEELHRWTFGPDGRVAS